MSKKSGDTKEIEFHPDAMKRFERAIDVVSKSLPQHRVAKKKKATAKKSKRGK